MTIAVGDVQGCHDCLLQLLEQVGTERLWFTGDLVNRGPGSLQTLRWAYRNRDRITTVLGNHDIHLLAVATGLRPAHRSDTLDPILAAPDRDELLDWLRCQPLAVREGNHLMVHAGVPPQWSGDQALELAAQVQQALSGPRWIHHLGRMFGNEPDRWDDGLSGASRLRYAVNALTRLRFCTADGQIDFKTKEGPGSAPPGYRPWFDWPGRRTSDLTVVFGHWSTLGLLQQPGLLGLDTGCVWGGQLTGVRLEDGERFQVACPEAAAPARH